MSRSPSKSLESPAMPRRFVLKALAAAPTAIAAATGQAFSATVLKLEQDNRFAKADENMRAINEAYLAFQKAADYEYGDAEGEAIYEAAGERFDAARDALEEYAAELASKTSKDLGDALVLARLADFHLVDERDNLYNLKDTAPSALRAILEVYGLEPTLQTVRSIEVDRLAELAASRSRPPIVFKPDSVAAGEDIAELRRLAAQYERSQKAASEVGSTWGSSPECIAAQAKCDQAFRELCDFCETVKQKVGSRYSARADFAILGNLVLAIDDIYLEELEEEIEFFGSQAQIDGRRNRALQQMIVLARKDGDKLVRDAEMWNAEHGGADV